MGAEDDRIDADGGGSQPGRAEMEVKHARRGRIGGGEHARPAVGGVEGGRVGCSAGALRVCMGRGRAERVAGAGRGGGERGGGVGGKSPRGSPGRRGPHLDRTQLYAVHFRGSP